MGTSREPVRIALRKLWSDRRHLDAPSTSSLRSQARLMPTRGRRGCSRTRKTSAPPSCRYYGQAGGDRLTELLKQHILIAVDLVAAAKAGDQQAFATHDARWTANIARTRNVSVWSQPQLAGEATCSTSWLCTSS